MSIKRLILNLIFCSTYTVGISQVYEYKTNIVQHKTVYSSQVIMGDRYYVGDGSIIMDFDNKTIALYTGNRTKPFKGHIIEEVKRNDFDRQFLVYNEENEWDIYSVFLCYNKDGVYSVMYVYVKQDFSEIREFSVHKTIRLK